MNRPDLKPLGVGIVGYGQFGRFLHRAWGEAVKAVCDDGRVSLATAVTATFDADGREGAFGDGRA